MPKVKLIILVCNAEFPLLLIGGK